MLPYICTDENLFEKKKTENNEYNIQESSFSSRVTLQRLMVKIILDIPAVIFFTFLFILPRDYK